MEAEAASIVVMRGMTKRFGTTVANDAIDFDLRPGEIHGLLGENGSGKTTLMSLLYGLHQPEAGEIRLAGELVRIRSPGDALARGIAMIPQRFRLVPTLTVAENVSLGISTPRRRHTVMLRDVARRLADLSQAYGLQTNPAAVVDSLSMGERQRVEILRALYHDARVLLMDEPTSTLTPQEVVQLSSILRRMVRDEQRSVVLVTHKIREALDLAQRITVLRGGRRVATFADNEVSTEALLDAMIGRRGTVSPQMRTNPQSGDGGPVDTAVLILTEVAIAPPSGTSVASVGLHDVSFSVRAGEILGIAGVEGNGQRELELLLAGLLRPTSGSIAVHAGRAGLLGRAGAVAYIPSDRDRLGLLPDLSVAENLLLRRGAAVPPFSLAPARHPADLGEAADMVARFGIHPPNLHAPVRHLSGGNMQKVVLARELSRNPALIVAAQPTMGLDVATTAFVRGHLRRAAQEGAAIVMISSDLDELIEVCDRITVMYRGRLVGEWVADGSSVASIGAAMAGLLSGA